MALTSTNNHLTVLRHSTVSVTKISGRRVAPH